MRNKQQLRTSEVLRYCSRFQKAAVDVREHDLLPDTTENSTIHTEGPRLHTAKRNTAEAEEDVTVGKVGCREREERREICDYRSRVFSCRVALQVRISPEQAAVFVFSFQSALGTFYTCAHRDFHPI